ncbi:hypothetical protein L861_01420 [Litchfieldella anticariensis FP35 = DSM 16096]|uniref:Proline racemase n=2 Tax=Litchfieldella anticariensis TaxID=258591 RepID=S2KQ30_LITA3|nr:hypothetical protein L861_01420 [Halomonas anticariensis FP35 = DSM 16096]
MGEHQPVCIHTLTADDLAMMNALAADHRILTLIDAHAGGDLGRVVMDGVGNLPKGSVAERALFLREQADGLRRLLIREPYGDPSHCINLVVPPASPEADAGLIIMGTMGYPDFSGSNAMCTVAALVKAGWLALKDGQSDLSLETPGGVTRLNVSHHAGELETVSYDALPGFVAAEGCWADVEGWGRVRYSLVYGGVFYAVVSATDVGLDPARTPTPTLTQFFSDFLRVAARQKLHHPVIGAMPPLSLALLANPLETDLTGVPVARVAVYMEPHVICRGPTGTGTTALLAWLACRGEIAPGSTIRTISPFGNEFSGTLSATNIAVGGHPAVGTRITGKPHLLSPGRIVIDLGDPHVDRRELEPILVHGED